MTPDDIIEMAKKAKLPYEYDTGRLLHLKEVERFAALVAAAERTRLHDKFMEIHKSQQHSNNYWHFAARKIKEESWIEKK